MPDVPGGPATSTLKDGGGSKLPKIKKCEGENCADSFPIPGPGNHRYCAMCKAKNSPAPGKEGKRKSNVLSPVDLLKVAKAPKDDMLEAALAGDTTAFLELDKESMFSSFKALVDSLLANEHDLQAENKMLAEQVVSLKSDLDSVFSGQTEAKLIDENRLLTDQIVNLKNELDKVKIVLADKVVRLFETSSSLPPREKPTYSNPNPRSFAETVKAAQRPVLIARVGGQDGVPIKDISEDKIDALFLEGDGPTVQHIKKLDDRVVLSFRDVASRDKAQAMLINNSTQKLFCSVSAPKKIFPALVRLHNVQGVKLLRGTDNKEAREKQESQLLEKLKADNPTLSGPLVSVRILHQRPNSNSFLVRIGLLSKVFCDRLIESGRILLDGATHAVVAPDPCREVRHCSRCQKYGHIHHFCKAAADVCGKCSLEHSTSSCTKKPGEFKCANCSQRHQVGSPSCPSLAKAVSQYLQYISSN